MTKIRLILTDDHPLILNGLRNLLHNSDGMEVLAAYHNGLQLLDGLEKQQPDVLLLDIQMPGYSGQELAGIIAKRHPDVKILVLTNEDSVHVIKSLLQSGAMGYVLKSASEAVILEAIRAVYAGRQFLEAEVRDKIVQHTIHTRQEQGALNASITRREKQVLQLVAANYTSQEIAEKLCISKRTVDNHRIGLLVKLGVKNSAGLVKKAVDLGLIS